MIEKGTNVTSHKNRAHTPLLKVCGMKYPKNMLELAQVGPDYMGLIFYDKSSRCFNGTLPELKSDVKRVGVFVNSDIDEIVSNLTNYKLNAVQLHGNESPEFCKSLKTQLGSDIEIIKVFSIKNSFDFSLLEPYEAVCDYFLFDTKGDLPGGNGETFDWNVLSHYNSKKKFFLSGGIGIDSLEELKAFLESPVAAFCHAIDVNSKFESEPGLKNIKDVKAFKESIQHINTRVL